MVSQIKTQSPTGQSKQHKPTDQPKRDIPSYMMSHGQGQVKNPQTDRRLKENRQ